MSAPAEWLEADGLGGFASGTASGIRTRRYHALLLVARTPPTDRVVLVQGVEATVETAAGPVAVTSHRYAPGIIHPDGVRRLLEFSADPWPAWTHDLGEGRRLVHEVLVPHGAPRVVLRWTLEGPGRGDTLRVRPLLSGRDYHALHRENPAFRFAPLAVGAAGARWQPYPSLPVIEAHSNGRYVQDPLWFRQVSYLEELERGLDDGEDVASPGVFHFDLATPALLVFEALGSLGAHPLDVPLAARAVDAVRARERGRRADRAPAARAAEAFVVRRGAGLSLIAGYPWFTDWGRDTCIALRGLALAQGRLDLAGSVLETWAGTIADGLVPNRFPDAGAMPEYHSADASLWFLLVVHEYLRAVGQGARVTARRRRAIEEAAHAVFAAIRGGRAPGLHPDDDGLLHCGTPGSALTWMDARVDGQPVTGRDGKPVEVQALWLNALAVAASGDVGTAALLHRAQARFAQRFWNPAAGCLHDVVDAGGIADAVDPRIRPNQLLAAGGLPHACIPMRLARQVVDCCERLLYTPHGMRTLAPDAPGYVGRYAGGPQARDAAYHQGTAWPWLLGPFVEAWVRTRRDAVRARQVARRRFLAPLTALVETGGGHLPELADGDAPHTPRGAPQQAWSLAEYLRLDAVVLAPRPRPGAPGAERA